MNAGLRILLVGNGPGRTGGIRELLPKTGGTKFTVYSAARLEEALELLRTDAFDAVLLNLPLPNSPGFNALDRIRSTAPLLPAIVMTICNDEKLAVEAVRHGAQDCLDKDSTGPELLRRAIRSAIERKRSENRMMLATRKLDFQSRRFSETLNDINIIIGSTLDFEQMIIKALEAATAALKADSSFLALGGGSGDSSVNYASGSDTGAKPGAPLSPANAPLALLALETGRLTAAVDIRHDRRFRKRTVRKLGFRSAIATPLAHKGKTLGALEFRYGSPRTGFSQAQTDFVEKLGASFSLALENSRLYRQERELRTHVQGYAAQLSLLNKIGISLNRETDRKKLLSSLLDGAALITAASVGCMMLVNSGTAELVSIYYAPGFERRCERLGDFPGLHHKIRGLLKPRQKNTLRLSARSFAKGFFDFPDGHLPLNGLLIGTLRDTRNRIRGYFMLSNKAEGAPFSGQDEEVVSLLAAQASVALVSLENFEREHTVASTLQNALMPELPVRDDLDFGVFYQSSSPVSRLGGDFYDFIELKQRRLAVLVGDVCGKGLEAATSTAMVKYTVRAYLQTDPDPASCLTRLNRAVTNQIAMDKFVTLSLAVIDSARQKLEYATAGHPPALLAAKAKTEFLQSEHSVPIGVVPGYKYSKKSKSVKEGCSLMMYTDGLIDARSADGESFGHERLLAAVSAHCSLKAQYLADSLAHEVSDFSAKEIKDDICLLAVRLKPRQPPRSRRRELPA